MSMSFSVVIPYYNKKYSINRAVKSCLANHDIEEIIIVDDGSDDEAVVDFVTDRVKIYRKENGGVSSARNYGIEKSNNQYVILLDADDELLPSFSTKLKSMVIHNPGKSLFALNYFLGVNGQLKKNRIFSPVAFNYIDCIKFNMYPFCSSSVCINKNSYFKFPEGITHGEDIITWLRYHHSKGIVYSNEMHSVYHFDDQDSAVSSSGVNLKVLKDKIKFLPKKENRIVMNRFLIQNKKREFLTGKKECNDIKFNYCSVYQSIEYFAICLILKFRN